MSEIEPSVPPPQRRFNSLSLAERILQLESDARQVTVYEAFMRVALAEWYVSNPRKVAKP